MITLNQLVFDSANPAESSNVGAYLRASDGSLIAHTSNALHVNVQNASIAVTDGGGSLTVDGSVSVSNMNTQYAEDSAHVSGDLGNLALVVRSDAGGSLAGTDGDYAPLQVDANGALRIAGSFSSNSEKAEDAAHSSSDVGSYSLSVRQDTPASSTSADGDYQSFKTDALGRLWINKAANSGAYGAVSVSTTATDIVTTDLVNRTRIIIQNLGSKDVYVGTNASVTTANGIKLSKGASMEVDAGAGLNWHGITPSGSSDVRYLEVA